MSASAFSDRELMQMILLAILLFAAYLAVMRKLQSAAEGRNLGAAAVVLLAIFICAGVALVIVARTIGGLEIVLLSVMLLLAAAFLLWFARLVLLEFSEVNKGAFALFVGCVLVILCGTVFFRTGDTDTTVQAEAFSAVKSALTGDGTGMLNHMILNVVLFVPYGFLFAMVHPRRLNSVLYSLMAGIMLSSIAEIMQLVMRAGQCDLDDILANTFGTVIGYAAYRLFLSRWRGDGAGDGAD